MEEVEVLAMLAVVVVVLQVALEETDIIVQFLALDTTGQEGEEARG